MTKTSALESHGEIDMTSREIYGEGDLLLRLGNGGAGATGVLRALATDYLNTLNYNASIAWVCNHSRNTQLALLHNHIDIALTYEREQEALAAAKGWSVTVGCVFHDHFVLAGPISDPANINSVNSLSEALLRIALSASLFHSRADASATMWKERSLWTKCGIEPWKNDSDTEWYKKSLFSPAEAVMAADAAGAYLLIDRSTLLHQTKLNTIHKTTVFFEPHGSDDVLMNSCFALVSVRAFETRPNSTTEFLDYLFSTRGQDIIANFGGDKPGKFPMFAPCRDGFAKSFLKGGFPSDGKWVIP